MHWHHALAWRTMLPNDLYPSFESLTLTQIGHLYGVSGQVVGNWLKQMDLRHPYGRPTEKARQANLASEHTPESGKPFWVWQKVPVVRLLEAAGHRRKGFTDHSNHDESDGEVVEANSPQLDIRILIGPFEAKPKADDGCFEICGGSGSIGIHVTNELLAKRLAGMLNVHWTTRKWFQES